MRTSCAITRLGQHPMRSPSILGDAWSTSRFALSSVRPQTRPGPAIRSQQSLFHVARY